MGRARQLWIAAASEISWRLPGWPVKLMSSFSQTERGSAIDMWAATELTERREMRRKYFLHALDESRHAILFRDRARALGGNDRTRAVFEDAGYLHEQGIVGGQTLFERLGELEFLAFVYVAEADAVEQFDVYQARKLPDLESREMLARILRDEAFHVSYSRMALEGYRKEGRGDEVDAALRQVRWNRIKERWLRFSLNMGSVVSGIWLNLMYALVIGPFRLFARLEPGGWLSPRRDPRSPIQIARSQG